MQQAYADGATNTLGGDQRWNLWMALNPEPVSPVNDPATVLTSSSPSASPGTEATFTGSGFAAGEKVRMHFGRLGVSPSGDIDR